MAAVQRAIGGPRTTTRTLLDAPSDTTLKPELAKTAHPERGCVGVAVGAAIVARRGARRLPRQTAIQSHQEHV